MATTIYASSGDGFVRNNGSGSWSSLQSAGTGTVASQFNPANAPYNDGTTADKYIDRGIFSFDLSSIPAGATITSATLSLYVTAKASGAGGAVGITSASPASTTALAATDFGSFGSTEYATRINFSAATTSAYNDFALNAAGLAYLESKIGTFAGFGVRGSFDLDNSAPGTTVYSQWSVRTSEQSGTSQDPKLLISYTLARTTGDTWAWSDTALANSGANYARTTTDTWAWSDTATQTHTNAKTTSDSWAWSDTAAGARSTTRTTTDAWAWSDSVSTIGQSRSAGELWAWADTATITGRVSFRTTSDTFTWSDSAVVTSTGPSFYSRTTSDTWAWVDAVTSSAAIPYFWLRRQRSSMSAPIKTYVQVQPKGTARTSTWTSPTYKAETEAGILVVLDVTAASGTGGLTLRINAHDQASSQAVPLNAAPTAVTATGTTSYALYPFGAVAGDVTQATSFYLPRMFSISVTHGDSSSYTYSVGFCLLP